MSNANGITLCPKGKAMEFEPVYQGGSKITEKLDKGLRWIREHKTEIVAGTITVAALVATVFTAGNVAEGQLAASAPAMVSTLVALASGTVTKASHDLRKGLLEKQQNVGMVH